MVHLPPRWGGPISCHTSCHGSLLLSGCCRPRTPCTVNSFLRWWMGPLWLAAKHTTVNLPEPTVILAMTQEIKDKLKQVPSWCSLDVWNLFYQGLFAAHAANLTPGASICTNCAVALLMQNSSNTSSCLCVCRVWPYSVRTRKQRLCPGLGEWIKTILILPSPF